MYKNMNIYSKKYSKIYSKLKKFKIGFRGGGEKLFKSLIKLYYQKWIVEMWITMLIS